MSINIITAKEARNNSYECIKSKYSRAMNYIMSKISESSKKGETKITLIEMDLLNSKEYEQISEFFNELISTFDSKTFHDYLRYLGFSTSFEEINRCNPCDPFESRWQYTTKKITISW